MFGKKKPTEVPRAKPVSDAEEDEAIQNLAEAFVWAEGLAHNHTLPPFLSRGGLSALRASLATTIRFMPKDVHERMKEVVEAKAYEFEAKFNAKSTDAPGGTDGIPQ